MPDLYGDGWPDEDEPRYSPAGRTIGESGDRCGKCKQRLRRDEDYAMADDRVLGREVILCEPCEEALGFG